MPKDQKLFGNYSQVTMNPAHPKQNLRKELQELSDYTELAEHLNTKDTKTARNLLNVLKDDFKLIMHFFSPSPREEEISDFCSKLNDPSLQNETEVSLQRKAREILSEHPLPRAPRDGKSS